MATSTSNELSVVLDRFVSRYSIPDIVDRLIRCKNDREVARADSYFHHNGFTVVELTRVFQTSNRIRLHVWWPGSQRRTDHIHTHPWDFFSHIIVGDLDTEYFDVSETGTLHKKYVCFSRPNRKGYSYDLIGLESLKLSYARRFEAGQTYMLDRICRHRVLGDAKRVSLTLVCLGNYVTRQSNVYYKTNESPPANSPNNYFGIESFVRELERIQAIT